MNNIKKLFYRDKNRREYSSFYAFLVIVGLTVSLLIYFLVDSIVGKIFFLIIFAIIAKPCGMCLGLSVSLIGGLIITIRNSFLPME